MALARKRSVDVRGLPIFIAILVASGVASAVGSKTLSLRGGLEAGLDNSGDGLLASVAGTSVASDSFAELGDASEGPTSFVPPAWAAEGGNTGVNPHIAARLSAYDGAGFDIIATVAPPPRPKAMPTTDVASKPPSASLVLKTTKRIDRATAAAGIASFVHETSLDTGDGLPSIADAAADVAMVGSQSHGTVDLNHVALECFEDAGDTSLPEPDTPQAPPQAYTAKTASSQPPTPQAYAPLPGEVAQADQDDEGDTADQETDSGTQADDADTDSEEKPEDVPVVAKTAKATAAAQQPEVAQVATPAKTVTEAALAEVQKLEVQASTRRLARAAQHKRDADKEVQRLLQEAAKFSKAAEVHKANASKAATAAAAQTAEKYRRDHLKQVQNLELKAQNASKEAQRLRAEADAEVNRAMSEMGGATSFLQVSSRGRPCKRRSKR